MVHFTGYSVHTLLQRRKPIPQGYTILALCDLGYTYSFIFTSRTNSFADLDPHLYSGQVKLRPNSQAVYQPASALLSDQFAFTVYMDNYFTNIRLLQALYEKGIGVYGTSRSTSAEYPKVFKWAKKPIFPFNTISGVVCQNVLVCLWRGNNIVRFISTVYEITAVARNFPNKQHLRPRITNTDIRNIIHFFGDQYQVTILIPIATIDYYNNKMNSIDLAD